METEDVCRRFKQLLVEHLGLEDLKPEEITDEEALFGGRIGLDSLDAVEIVVILQRHFGVELGESDNPRDVLRTTDSIARFIEKKRSAP